MERKWLPSFAELIDRLSIHQLKEVFIPEDKEKYRKDMKDIVHDLNLMINENKIEVSGELIRCIIIQSQINAHIWYNEAKARNCLADKNYGTFDLVLFSKGRTPTSKKEVILKLMDRITTSCPGNVKLDVACLEEITDDREI